MLTLTPADPRVRYRDELIAIKVETVTEYESHWVEAEATSEESFLDSHLVRGVGTAFYGTSHQHEYLIERDSPLFLSETLPSGFEFVIELYISSDLLHLTPESLETVKLLLNVNSEIELTKSISTLGQTPANLQTQR